MHASESLALTVGHGEGRAAFVSGLDVFIEVATGLTDDELLVPSRCHGWAVCDLLAHVHLGLQEMLTGVVSPTDAAPDTDAASYWLGSVPTNDDSADRLDQVRFARLLASAYHRPRGLLGHLEPTAAALRRAVRAMEPGRVAFQSRVLTTGDFLATWAVELAVHHLDLGRELDLPSPAGDALCMARRTVEALAGGPLPADWSDERVVLLGAGRAEPTEPERNEPTAARLPVLG